MVRRKKVAAAATEASGKGKGKGKGKTTTSARAGAGAAVNAIDETTVVESVDFPSFENMDTIGYVVVQRPLEALNIVYPHPSLIEYINNPNDEFDIAACIGKEGLRHVMSYEETGNPPMRLNFEYRLDFTRNFRLPSSETTTKTSSRIFAPENIGRYSAKIKNICDTIVKSDGIVLAYSQYIDGGVVPMALALEELGFTRYSVAGGNSSLFRNRPTPTIDAITMLPQRQHQSKFPNQPFRPARYSVITGDPTISPDNLYELKALTNDDNTHGENVKVVIISVAGSEGLDFKNIRQVHILEPWYNMNLLEQIIGRAIRNCSHKRLPYSHRNVELYLYGSQLSNPEIEAIDLYLYRLSEFKAVKIGVVSRALRTSAVDCLLNIQHNTQTAAQLNQVVQQNLSSRKRIDYQVGARPYSALCDYMERCEYTCRPTFSNGRPIQEQEELYGMGDDSDSDSDSEPRQGGNVRLDTFNEKFMSMNMDKIIHKIKELYKERFFYKKTGARGIISHINSIRHYPIAQINLALTQIVSDPNEYVNDKYGRLGRVINVGEYYLFQPIELTDKHITIHERSAPVAYKHTSVDYPLAAEVTEDYLGIGDGGVAGQSSSSAPAAAASRSNKSVASKVKKAVASLGAEVQGSFESSERIGDAVVVGQPEDAGSDAESDAENKAIDILTKLANKFETCQTLYDKPTKDHVEWYYYCEKIIDQISRTEEFQITKEEMIEFIIARLLEEIDKFEDSLVLLNYLYQKNNYSMTTTVSSSAGGGGAGSASISIQPLIPFERMILNYYSQQMIRRVLVGRRAAAAAASASGAGSTSSVPQDQGLLLFHEKQKPNYTLVVLRYETREWTVAEPEDQRDFKLLLDELQTKHIQNINTVVGFISLFKNEYLVFKVRVMSNKRDKGARCDQAGKTETITLINKLLSLNETTNGDVYKLTNENTKFRTQRELCVFQEFLFRTFNKNRINGRKWFFTPSESILCDIENI